VARQPHRKASYEYRHKQRWPVFPSRCARKVPAAFQRFAWLELHVYDDRGSEAASGSQAAARPDAPGNLGSQDRSGSTRPSPCPNNPWRRRRCLGSVACYEVEARKEFHGDAPTAVGKLVNTNDSAGELAIQDPWSRRVRIRNKQTHILKVRIPPGLKVQTRPRSIKCTGNIVEVLGLWQ